jgi:L-fuculose-phosphate aldolase
MKNWKWLFMDQIKKQILQISKALHSRNLLAAADGNISYRHNDDEILITPTGQTKAFINEDEVAKITIDNKVISGKPSSERLMHLEIYKNCPKAKAVVHAHPPTAIAWSLAFPNLKELPHKALPEVILAAGKIPIVDYARPGTQDMGKNLIPFLPEYRLLILARHGAVCWGEDLDEAYRGLERVEHVCQILKSAMELSSSYSNKQAAEINFGSDLPESEIKALFELRKTIGPKIL